MQLSFPGLTVLLWHMGEGKCISVNYQVCVLFYTTNGSHSHFYIILQALRLYRIWVIHQFVILALLFRCVVGTAIDLGCKWQKNPKITGFNGIGLFLSCVKNVWIYVIQGPVCPRQMSATQVLSILLSSHAWPTFPVISQSKMAA